jgi:hypothetical protein
MRRIVRTLIGFGSMAVAMATTAGTAFAGSDYNGPGDVAGQQTGGGGSLPFTGSDLLMYVLVGGSVIVAGIALRLLAPRRGI